MAEQCGTCQCRFCGGEYDNAAIESLVETLTRQRDEAWAEVERLQSSSKNRTEVRGYMKVRFVQNVSKSKQNGETIPRIVIAKFLDELEWKPGDELLAEVDTEAETIVIWKPK